MNVVFAISSLALIVTTLWLVWVDWDRPWKAHQQDYMNAQGGLAELEYVITQKESFQDTLAAARAEVQEAAKTVDRQLNPEYDALLAELRDTQDQLYGLDLEFKQKDAWIVVTRSEYEKAVALEGTDSERARQLTEKLEQDEAALAATRLTKQGAEDHLRSIKNSLRDIENRYRQATRKVQELENQVADAARKRDQYLSVANRAVFNMPLLDFTAPKATPGRFEVKQVVAQDVKSKLNFLEGYKVDRCNTCHVVIADRSYAEERLVGLFEEAIPAISEVMAREGGPQIGLPNPPPVYGLTAEQMLGQVARRWARVGKEERRRYFGQLQEQINAYLKHVGIPALELSQPLLAHPDLDLFLDADSPHPMSQMGCTVCHEGNGSETDFVFAAHTPVSHQQEHEWTEKYYDRNLGVPTMTWSTLEHFWDFPMIPPKYSEASCAKCHTRLNDIGEFRGRAYGTKVKQGLETFARLGCINCHKVENMDGLRQVGTDLSHVASKLSDGFMHNWILNPQRFRPATLMPHFFMQENNGPGSENKWDPDPVQRTRTEVQAITAYLKAVSTPWEPQPLPAGLTGDAAGGQSLFAAVGCLACHGNLAEYGPQWITTDLWYQLRQQSPGADEDALLQQATAGAQAMDLNAQAQYAMNHFTEDRHALARDAATEEELRAAAEGRVADPLKLYVPPVFTRFAPDLSGIGSKVTAEWLYSWLRAPRHYSSYTKMPRLRLSDQEALDLTTYLLTLKHADFDQQPFAFDAPAAAALDQGLTDLLSGQHSQESVERIKSDSGGILSDMLVSTISKHPDREIATQREQRYRALVESMDTHAKQMVFFGQKMITHYGCYACHSITGFEGAARPGTELTFWAEKSIHQLDFAFFGGAWHHTLGEQESFRTLFPQSRDDLSGWSNSGNLELDIVHTHGSFARHKLLNPRIWDREKFKKPYEKLRMPNFYLTGDEAEAVVTYLLSRRPPRVAETLQVKYDGRPAGPLAGGRHLVRELNCIGCHKIEQNVATVHQFITASAGAAATDDWEDDWDADEGEDSLEAAPAKEDSGLTPLGDRFGGPFDLVNGPPWLRGEGAKVQPAWFHNFLLNVEPLRPWLKVRMPSFYLTSQDASELVRYFDALTEHEAEWLQDELKDIHKAVASADDPATARPQWHADGALQDTAALLSSYSIVNELIKPRAFDFRNSDAAAVDAVFRDVLANVEFFAHLYDTQFPFEPDGYTPLDSQRREVATGLFQELKCLSCHVLGDPAVPGSNPTPSAPNLALAHRRLRYEWFHQWLQEPQKMQPGTKMPQWFPGGRSAFTQEMGYGDDLRVPLEAKYSDNGPYQMSLLMDYVWQAGLTHSTVLDPARLPPPPEAEPQAQAEPVPPIESPSAPPAVTRPVSAVVLKERIIDPAAIGPRPSPGDAPAEQRGAISGRVVWTAETPTVDYLPVGPAYREACSPGSASKALDRLTISEHTGGVPGCVVYLAGDAGAQQAFPPPNDSLVIDIEACEFSPRVQIVPRGSTVRFANHDALPHNVRAREGRTLLWSKNLAPDEEAELTLERLGIVDARSGSGFDWMTCYLWVVDHGAYAVTDADGNFTLTDIPPGEYTVHAWHPGIHPMTSGGGEPGMPAVNFEPPRVVGGTVTLAGDATAEVILQLH